MTSQTLNPKVVQREVAQSTPVSDKTPKQISSNEFGDAIRALESELASFTAHAINDDAVRADYRKKTQAAVNEIIDAVKQRKLTPHEGAQAANALRNQIMELSRSNLTSFGLAYSKSLKETGKTIAELEQKYALKLFSKDFATVTPSEREAVWREIIDRAGASNGAVNRVSRVAGNAGRALLIASLAIAVYSVATADDKPREAAKQATGLGAGIAGGAAGGAAIVAIASGPVGWLAVGLGVIVGAALAGIGANETFDYFWPEK
ncbi:hypothetical protein [Chitinimonas sp. BJB300]|uniref:hypothetical protein n=1 Tax=Chitinimonas sp. BJB300 TaxID=1559339 RepID=UPI000C0C7944|nr:hypothetical protein [Chitinimonas sp. BJB300]PHV11331.1 hypothetical protein CSQ89_11555 [Chitinimonas sp. BJB300]TSJ88226.1 hypothetical protein FG002_012015 [Chitinimonas sp. BJB300]